MKGRTKRQSVARRIYILKEILFYFIGVRQLNAPSCTFRDARRKLAWIGDDHSHLTRPNLISLISFLSCQEEAFLSVHPVLVPYPYPVHYSS